MINLIQPHALLLAQTALTHQFVSFEQKIQQLAQIIKLDLAQFNIDHLAIRVNGITQGQKWRDMLLQFGELLSDNQVNGRQIYLIKLDEPLYFAGQAVSVVELPMPKNKLYPIEGWEHIELVVPFLAAESPIEWQQRMKRQFFLNKNDLVKVKVSEPKVEGEQLNNMSIAVTLQDNSNNYCCIKLHPHHIIDVVRSENSH